MILVTDFEADRQATVRTFLARFDALVDQFSANTTEIETLSARLAELNGAQEAIRATATQLTNAAQLLGIDLNAEIDARQERELAEVDEHLGAAAEQLAQPALQGRPTVREYILQEAEKAFPEPVRAAAIRSQMEKAYGLQIHEKTVGMTLYRLSKEERPLMRRAGKQDWYFVPENAQHKQMEIELFS